MQLFYHPELEENDTQVIFPKDESKHIAKVLRKKEGDVLEVTNGKGFLFSVELIQTGNQALAKVLKVKTEESAPYYLHMAVAPTKMNDRFEWFLEKATEIGVHEITPIICDHSERKVVKLNRFERVLQSAMKQSLHFRIPKLNEPQSFSEFLATHAEGDRFIAHCEDDKQRFLLKNSIKPKSKSIMLIGPEGDFSSEEIQKALEQNWQPVSLGDSRLRTETAAIVACHTFALANQE
ncbi:16S rRNA (uracil(1498)-N(3))-methyltransferase [Salegentibacter sp. F188]|uniref:Ribosomal RNA small subunit methyltransferase E n=1 Tax=Autumnicola patrickiae TaxID=3075591 RepID=A0ABU3E2J8_9FLAO|nr:16S rRNA (uracil(1498)-N(3))-methyltransferase [Salegentibacter sp. F188]MDT0690202.1 16S rRNA (uracil(1498)-N(3))-methyltransferase [Salegentibacter sp. F188]